jgi:hypothetical protein
MNRLRGARTLIGLTSFARARAFHTDSTRRYCGLLTSEGAEKFETYYRRWVITGAVTGGIGAMALTIHDERRSAEHGFRKPRLANASVLGSVFTITGAVFGAFIFATAPISFPVIAYSLRDFDNWEI